ncbi:MAG: DNA gyrase subunit A, partial [Sphingomonadales bacterium]
GYEYNKPYKKSARIIGDVMGKYHPHGDSSIYDALVRLAQSFSMRLPLIDGQGNFGSMDGDPPAAMRYTEARLAKVKTRILGDINKGTVDFQENYDNSESEPTVLPARFPNLLVNGASGIAVGMATNIPPHNLGEIIDATCALIDDPEIDTEGLSEIVTGPDFPTGATILGRIGIRESYETGRGSIKIRSKTHVEEVRKDREAIIVTEIPYQVNKSSLVEKIAECVRAKRIEGISDLRDESDRDGVRVVIELKRDAVSDVVLNQLHRFTQLQTSFGINMLALDGGRPKQMGLKQILTCFITFREEVITRRTKFDLAKARDRAHLLVGLVIAVANIDDVVAVIRGAPNPAMAREKLLARKWSAKDVKDFIELIGDPRDKVLKGRYQLSEEQVKAILDLRLHRLTGLGREEIGKELDGLAEDIKGYLEILTDRKLLYGILREELVEVRDEFANPRRTEIAEGYLADIDDEDLIKREEMVVTVTHSGYVKRVPLSTYRAQRRGGKGRAGMSTKDEDFLTTVFVTSTHTPVLFFSSAGQVYKLKVWKLPVATPQARGKAIINILPLDQDETISTILPLPEDEETWGELNVMFATRNGKVRRNSMADFVNIRANGKIAIRFDEGSDDRLINVGLCQEEDDVLLATRSGKAIRFSVGEVRQFKGRTATGVRGIRLAKGDRVISMSILKGQTASVEDRTAYLKAAPWKAEPQEADLPPERMEEMAEAEDFILSMTVNGFGKRTSSHEYRTMHRGGKGVVNIETSERNGEVVASFPVEDTDQIMMVTDQGKIIRTPINTVRVAGRSTQGVTLFDVAEGEHIVSVAKLGDDGEDDDEGLEGDGLEGEDGVDLAEGEAGSGDGDTDGESDEAAAAPDATAETADEADLDSEE